MDETRYVFILRKNFPILRYPRRLRRSFDINFFNLSDNRYTYTKGLHMDKEYTNIDSIIVDLIMDHFNIQTMEGRSTNLSDDDFDRIVDVAESIYLKKVVIQEKPALA
jgi:hypothetical protein